LIRFFTSNVLALPILLQVTRVFAYIVYCSMREEFLPSGSIIALNEFEIFTACYVCYEQRNVGSMTTAICFRIYDNPRPPPLWVGQRPSQGTQTNRNPRLWSGSMPPQIRTLPLTSHNAQVSELKRAVCSEKLSQFQRPSHHPPLSFLAHPITFLLPSHVL